MIQSWRMMEIWKKVWPRIFVILKNKQKLIKEIKDTENILPQITSQSSIFQNIIYLLSTNRPFSWIDVWKVSLCDTRAITLSGSSYSVIVAGFPYFSATYWLRWYITMNAMPFLFCPLTKKTGTRHLIFKWMHHLTIIHYSSNEIDLQIYSKKH